MKTKSFLTVTMLFLLNMAIGQQTLNVSIEKADAGEVAALGSAKVIVKGGTAPYYVLWSSGSTKQTVEGLKPGNYLVRVSDSKGETIEQKIIIEDKTVSAISKP
jgi:hypothetical protein